jgi:short-subunit dehydrogenase
MAVAFITGASSGLGAEFARQLGAQGYDLLLSARREEMLLALATDIREKHGVDVSVLVADLASQSDIDRVAATIKERSDIDVLINNAGFGTLGPLATIDPAKPRAMVDVHVTATTVLTTAVLPQMVQRGKGAVVNVSSVAAFISSPNNVTYCASKAYLNRFSESLQAEVAHQGISVQALCPGWTYTSFHDTDEFKNVSRKDIPSKLWMTSEYVVSYSLHRLWKKPVIVVPGFYYKLIIFMLKTPGIGALIRARVQQRNTKRKDTE